VKRAWSRKAFWYDRWDLEDFTVSDIRVVRVANVLALLLALLTPAVADAAARLSFDDLLANLKSPNAKTRQEAAAALGKARRREAIPGLSALARDSESKVRFEGAHALRELRDPAAIPALVTFTEDAESNIRQEAIMALVELYVDTDRAAGVERFIEVFSDQYDRTTLPPHSKVEPAVLRALTLGLRDDDPRIREESALALGLLGARSSLPELGQALQDPEPSVRGAAALAIAKLGGAEHGKALVALLADDAGSVRNRVLHAIGVLKVKEAGPALRETFEANRRKEIGLRALEALSRVADPAQADLFRELIQDADPGRRRLAIEGLARVSDASVLPAFKKDYQREKSDELKVAYSFAITLLGDRAFLDSVVLNLPSRTLGKRCRDYVMELGRGVLPELYTYLNDPDADIRAELCDILAMMGDPASVPRLSPLVNDPSPQVADRANRAIEHLRRAGAEASSR
jgi:HEAT repeat protein